MNARFDDFLCTYCSRLAFAVAVASLCFFGTSPIFISLSLALNCCISASSAESMGRFRFGKSSQRVIEGYFHSFVGAKAIGSSGHHSNLVVRSEEHTSELQ